MIISLIKRGEDVFLEKLYNLGCSKVTRAQMIGYYQIINGLEVTGWITVETYFSILHKAAQKEEMSSYMSKASKLSAKELVDLIGYEIQFIQENKNNAELCDNTYEEIKILLENLRKTPEYVNNQNLKEVDWILKVGEDTPGFRDIVDTAFKKENIFANGVGTLPRDYLDQYSEQFAANVLTVIDGVIIIGLGGVLGYEYATTGTIVLTVGGETLAENYEQLVAYAQTKGNFSSKLLEHIFKGVTRSNGKVSGVHFEKFLDNGLRVVKTSATNQYGVYEGMVYRGDVLVKGTSSTFFPADWTGTQVMDAIAEAFNNLGPLNPVNNSAIGVTGGGMRIQFFFDVAMEITSAFPLMK